MTVKFTKPDQFEDLIGRTLVTVTGVTGQETMHFADTDGTTWKMYHNQDCCESVQLEEIVGDLNDLIGSPILRAECVTNSGDKPSRWAESWTWTFYKLATIKGEVVLRWLGESNGYYSEGVTFECTHMGPVDLAKIGLTHGNQ